jgi:transcriptional regulator with XRE-family HTH domain
MLGQDIKRECERRGIGLPAAASEMHLRRETVWRWVSGQSTPDPVYVRIVTAWLKRSRRRPPADPPAPAPGSPRAP